MMLTAKQKRYLRALATNLQPVMQVGKNGLSDNFIKTFNDALEAHELIKISVLPNCCETKTKLSKRISEQTDADFVQSIGNQLIFYRISRTKAKEKRITLP